MSEAKKAGAQVDKILYPSTFGPKGELLGIAVACDIKEGETILSVPCSYRVDLSTIYASQIGPLIRSLTQDESDEELAMCLYFMHQRILGESSHLYTSIITATPPDLPLGWSDEEVKLIQDKHAIESVHLMKAYINGLYERMKPKLQDHVKLFF